MKKYFTLIAFAFIVLLFGSAFIDLSNLDNYAGQSIPNYITKNNTPVANPLTNAGATLGRVLFYDKKLSLNNTISCSNCHMQQFAFGDTAKLSKGFLGGLTGRHSMRLSHSRFGTEAKFFWDERATSLENQTTRPIQDFTEMGFSGTSSQPNLDSLIRKMHTIPYYKTLFQFVYGDTVINETRMQQALAQFVRSIYSFDSKFDAGLAQTGNINANFPNYTTEENQGKALFINPPPAGGAGCQGCHRAPEFDIDPNTQNNGVVAVANSTSAIDITNTRAPSLRDVFNSQGLLNGPLMHNGNFTTMEAVIEHYNLVPVVPGNTNLDPRVSGPGGNLQLSAAQKASLVAFLKTLSSNAIYNGQRWSNPFDASGNLNMVTVLKEIASNKTLQFSLFPNPASDKIQLKLNRGNYRVKISDGLGKIYLELYISENNSIHIEELPAGYYYVEVLDMETQAKQTKPLLKL
jgi:cytochrome c peroxidase